MFGSGGKVKVSDELLKKIKVACEILGCDQDEFVEKTLGERVEQVLASTGKKEASEEEIAQIASQMQGLGYLE